MVSVPLPVSYVVEDVDRRARGAHRGEGYQGSQELVYVRVAGGEQQSCEDQEVLAPLLRPKQPDEVHRTHRGPIMLCRGIYGWLQHLCRAPGSCSELVAHR